jgi:hypothetical protein
MSYNKMEYKDPLDVFLDQEQSETMWYIMYANSDKQICISISQWNYNVDYFMIMWCV